MTIIPKISLFLLLFFASFACNRIQISITKRPEPKKIQRIYTHQNAKLGDLKLHYAAFIEYSDSSYLFLYSYNGIPRECESMICLRGYLYPTARFKPNNGEELIDDNLYDTQIVGNDTIWSFKTLEDTIVLNKIELRMYSEREFSFSGNPIFRFDQNDPTYDKTRVERPITGLLETQAVHFSIENNLIFRDYLGIDLKMNVKFLLSEYCLLQLTHNPKSRINTEWAKKGECPSMKDMITLQSGAAYLELNGIKPMSAKEKRKIKRTAWRNHRKDYLAKKRHLRQMYKAERRKNTQPFFKF